jgi:hypothetical protein
LECTFAAAVVSAAVVSAAVVAAAVVAAAIVAAAVVSAVVVLQPGITAIVIANTKTSPKTIAIFVFLI